jgi:hypothetical protein
MGWKRRIILLVVSAAVIIACGWLVVWSRGPTYAGRPIRTWIMEADGDPREVRVAAAESVIRKMGTNAWPAIFKMLHVRDSQFRLNALEWANDHLRTHFNTRPDQREPDAAVHAIECLAPEARRVALPELNRLLQGHETCGSAAAAFAVVGPEGVPYLNQALTNADFFVQTSAAAAFSSGGTNFGPTAEMAVTNLIKNLGGTNELVRRFSSDALVTIGKKPEIIVPALLQRSSNLRTRGDVSSIFEAARLFRGISKFGTNAQSAVPILTAALEDPNPRIREAATNALQKINSSTATSNTPGNN